MQQIVIFVEKIFKEFADSKNYQEFKSHFHYTSKYRGAAHSMCNLRLNAAVKSCSFLKRSKL